MVHRLLQVTIPPDRRRALNKYRRDPTFHWAVDITAKQSTFSRSQLLNSEGPRRITIESSLLGIC